MEQRPLSSLIKSLEERLEKEQREEISFIIEYNKPFYDLVSEIIGLMKLAENKTNRITIIEHANGIASSARIIDLSKLRSDSIKQFFDVVARSYEHPNRPENYVNASHYIGLRILDASRDVDIRMQNVNGFVLELRKMGLNADYLPKYTLVG